MGVQAGLEVSLAPELTEVTKEYCLGMGVDQINSFENFKVGNFEMIVI